MKIKSIIYILSVLALQTACTADVLDSGVGEGTLTLGIGELKVAAEHVVETRTNLSGTDWITGDKVTTNVTFLRPDETDISVHTIAYEYDENEGWTTDDGKIALPREVDGGSIKIEAIMEHLYTNETGSGDGDMAGDFPVRGKETMRAASHITTDIRAHGSYTVILNEWERTSALLEVTGLENVQQLKVSKGEEEPMVATVSDKTAAYFHVEGDTEYQIVVTKKSGNTEAFYVVGADMLKAGYQTTYNLTELHPGGGLFDPLSKLPVIPEFPGYVKYKENDGKTTYYVANGNGLMNVFEEIKTGTETAPTIKLVNNIDLTNVENFTPFAEADEGFGGTFDGNNNTVSGLNVETFLEEDQFEKTEDYEEAEPEAEKYQCTGLFAYLKEGGVIKNVTLKDIKINVRAQKENVDVIVGSIVGLNRGRVENCHIIGTPTTGSSIIGYGQENATKTYDTRVGGIVGMNLVEGKVIACSILGKMTVEARDNHFTMAGGIVGYNFGDVVACFADGNHFASSRYSECGYALSNQGIRIEAHSHDCEQGTPRASSAGIVAYSDIRGDFGANAKVWACYANLDHGSHVKSYCSSTNASTEQAAITAHDSGATNYSYWNKGTDVTSPTEYIYVGAASGVSGGKVAEWPGTITALNEGIEKYSSNGGICDWVFYNPEESKIFQPSLKKTN